MELCEVEIIDPYWSSVNRAYNMDDKNNLSDEVPQMSMIAPEDPIDFDFEIITIKDQKKSITVDNPMNCYNLPQPHMNALDQRSMIDSFLNENEETTKYESDIRYNFIIEDSPRLKNVPYKVKDKFLVAKINEEIKIKVEGAHFGHYVKMFMRFKARPYHNRPVLACERHKKEFSNTPNPESTFYVFTTDYQSEVDYADESGHHVALITVSMKDFDFSTMFTCWNSCSVPNKRSKKEELVLRLYDSNTGEKLHEDVFEVRVSQNIGRDFDNHFKNENETLKRKRTPSGKRGRPKAIKLESPEDKFEESCDSVSSSSDLLASPPTASWYKVQLDEKMYNIVKEILSLRGFKIVPDDPPPSPLHPQMSNFYPC